MTHATVFSAEIVDTLIFLAHQFLSLEIKSVIALKRTKVEDLTTLKTAGLPQALPAEAFVPATNYGLRIFDYPPLRSSS